MFRTRSSSQSTLSLQQSLELASICISNARTTKDFVVAQELCHDAETSLSRIKKTSLPTLASLKSTEDQNLHERVTTTYSDLGELQVSLGRNDKAQASYKNAEQWRGSSSQKPVHVLQPNGALPSTANIPAAIPSSLSLGSQQKQGDDIVHTRQIFVQNVQPSTIVVGLPNADERLDSTPQLAYCMGLLQAQYSSDDSLDTTTRNWLQDTMNNTDEYERLGDLATGVIREFKRDEIKDAMAIAEVLYLVPVLERDASRDLIREFFTRIDQSDLLDVHQLEGLAQLIQSVKAAYLDADDLVKILELLSKRLSGTHGQSPHYIYQLTLTVSHVLDAMADTNVNGLNREKLHAPLMSYLERLKKDSDPHLVYQAAYAYQALQYVPDDETLWSGAFRRTGAVIQGASRLVSAVKGLDLNKFIDGLKDLQQGFEGAYGAFQLVGVAYKDVTSLAESGKGFLDSLKEGFSFERKHAKTLLGELETNGDAKKRALYEECRQEEPGLFQLRFDMPTPTNSTLLNRVQDKPDVETNLRQLKKRRINERGNVVYIPPQAKASLHTSDELRFPLTDRVNEYLKSDQTVLLLLGDSGSGKSTFNRSLEFDLWQAYNTKTGIIPLYINLPAIDKPEHDLVAKQLRKLDFTEAQIRELKYRRFILICDGYDESQQTRNLYMSNRLNEEGEWIAKMVISCRSEYAGHDYRDRFEPGGRNQQSGPKLFDEAVITPFSTDQIQEYVKQYVDVHRPLWETEYYTQALDFIPGLMELVKNPFLLTMSLEVLPRMMDPGQQVSAARITKVALYDQFVGQWLERGKKRVGEKNLSFQARSAFDSLCDEGFTMNGIDYLKKLCVAIYKEQGGQPVVDYSRLTDEGTWKAAFFSRNEEKQLLREACPLVRNGNQYRFIHRSILEYGLGLAVFDPQFNGKKPTFESTLTRRGSTSSIWSFEVEGGLKDVVTSVTEEPHVDPDSPLVWRSFVKDTSIIQFLSERVQQEPVFKQQLLDYIELSKTDKKWRTAAASAITILIRAGVHFNYEDMQGIQIPGADLSYGAFESAQLQGADLRRVNLRGTCLRQADLSGALMTGVQFGELPFLKLDTQRYTGTFSCAYSPDGESLAVAHYSGDIKVYSTSSWDHVRTLAGHKRAVNSIAYSPKGDQIISGSEDHTARLWDVESGACLYTLTGHSKVVSDVSFAPFGDTVASASRDGSVRVWDVGTGKCRLTLADHTGDVWAVAYSPKGNMIASGDFFLRLWDVQTGASLRLLRGHMTIRAITFSPRGDRIATCADKTSQIWDVETGTCCRVLTGHTDYVVRIAFSTQGDVIASASNDKTIRTWDAETGTCRQVLTGHSGFIHCVVFSPKEDRIASCDSENIVRLWDLGSEGTRQFANGHTKEVSSVKYSPRGDQVASCSHDMSIRLWDVKTGFCRRVLEGHSRFVTCIAYSPRGDLIVSGSDDGDVRLWDVDTGACRQIFRDHWMDKSVVAVAFSPQGDQIASGDTIGKVRIWDVGADKCRRTFSGETFDLTSIVYSPDGNQIVSSGKGYTILIWDINSSVPRRILSVQSRWIASIVYSPQGNLLASAGHDSTVRLWDVVTGDCLYILIGHSKAVRAVAYSPLGGQVASGGEDGLLKIWDDGTGECLHTLAGHTKRVTNVVYSPKGDQILSGSEDMTVRLWDVASGQCLAVVQDFNDSVRSIAWSKTLDANYFVTGCEDGSVRMWKVVEMDGVCRVRVHWRPVDGVLNLTETSIQDVHGLSQLNKRLLDQRGAVGTPLHTDHLREMSTLK
ncbi:MAG: WD40-repeat-containing domain protein [Benniella sp.]|nr:MAG: WD40-repeat-containing domain protein [Benniella sp.]